MNSSRTLSHELIVTDRARYLAEVRPELRSRMIALRAARRVRLGDTVALEFESPETLLYQVQEMVIVEGALDDQAVSHELEAYSRLLPDSHSLTATAFLEGDDVATVKEDLLALTGLQHAIALEITPIDEATIVIPGLEVPGIDKEGPSEVTQAVHFLRFNFDDTSRDAFRDPSVPVELVADHPAYAASTPIDGDLRRRLLADLSLEG